MQLSGQVQAAQGYLRESLAMKTALETIRENIARIERRMKRTKSQPQREKLARLKGQWTFLLSAHSNS